MKNKEYNCLPQNKYDNFSDMYDILMALPEFLFLHPLRRKLIQSAWGNILEIAAGTGRNFQYYSQEQKVTAIDASPSMLEIARKNLDKSRRNIRLLHMSAEALDFPDQTFDTVISSLAMCSIPNPIAALKEMSRVCKKEGKLLLLEHGRSSWEGIGKLQDKFADPFARHYDCHMNRKPVEMVEKAGLKIIRQKDFYWGIVNFIEAEVPFPES